MKTESKTTGQMLGRIFLCSLKSAVAVAVLLVFYDIFMAGELLELASRVINGSANEGMGIGFHLIYIMIGIGISIVAGTIIGAVWALIFTAAPAKNKVRAGVVWFFLLAFASVAFISKNSPEIQMSGHDLEDLRASEVAGGKLKVTGRLADNIYGVSRIEEEEYQDEYGSSEIVVHVYAKASDGGRRSQFFDHTLDLPSHVKRVFVGGQGVGELVWGALEESPQTEDEGLEDKSTPRGH